MHRRTLRDAAHAAISTPFRGRRRLVIDYVDLLSAAFAVDEVELVAAVELVHVRGVAALGDGGGDAVRHPLDEVGLAGPAAERRSGAVAVVGAVEVGVAGGAVLLPRARRVRVARAEGAEEGEPVPQQRPDHRQVRHVDGHGRLARVPEHVRRIPDVGEVEDLGQYGGEHDEDAEGEDDDENDLLLPWHVHTNELMLS